MKITELNDALFVNWQLKFDQLVKPNQARVRLKNC